MTDTITLTGLVATDARHIVTSEGLPITTFRLASTQRRFDRAKERWIDGDTNWYTITSFRQLAINSAGSVKKGERIVVTGRLKIREWQNSERAGTTIDIEADAIGHDLAWGTTTFSRTITASGASSATADPEASGAEAVATDSGVEAGAGSAVDPEADAEAPNPAREAESLAAVPF